LTIGLLDGLLVLVAMAPLVPLIETLA
jgi:hypothetical protein